MPIVNFVLAGSLQVRCKDMPAGQIGIGQTIIFVPCGFFFLLSSSFFPRLISTVGDWILPYMVWPWCKFRMQVWNVLHAAHWKYRKQNIDKKSPSGHHRTTLSAFIFTTKACIDNWKYFLSSNISSTCPHNMVNFGPVPAEIVSLVWGTPANFNGFCVLAALLHCTLVVSVSQTLWRSTEGATYIWQGDHHVGHWKSWKCRSGAITMPQSLADAHCLIAMQ